MKDAQFNKITEQPVVALEINQCSQRPEIKVKLLTTENINDQNSFVFWTFLNVKETT